MKRESWKNIYINNSLTEFEFQMTSLPSSNHKTVSLLFSLMFTSFFATHFYSLHSSCPQIKPSQHKVETKHKNDLEESGSWTQVEVGITNKACWSICDPQLVVKYSNTEVTTRERDGKDNPSIHLPLLIQGWVAGAAA